MALRRLVFILAGILCVFGSSAQAQGDLVQSRVLILLDRSSSMVQSWAGGKEKYKAADELIRKLVDSIYSVNPEVEVGLRVFGHQYPASENNCYDTKLEVLFSKDARTQMTLRLADIHPYGVTPIAWSLQQAATNDITDISRNAYSIVLITDGGESCGGDICAIMAKYLKDKVHFRPYIVSLEDQPQLKGSYACLGDYLSVLNHTDMINAVGTIVEAFRPVLKVTADDYKEMQQVAANAPSVLKVTTPTVNYTPTKEDTAKRPVKEKIVFTKPPPNVKIQSLYYEKFRMLPINISQPEVHGKLSIPDIRATEDSVKPKPAIITKLQVRPKPIEMTPPGPISVRALPVPIVTFKPILDTPKTDRQSPKIARLQPAAMRNFNVIFVIEDRPLTPRRVPQFTPIKIEEPVVLAPKPKKPTPPPAEKKSGEFKVETEEAKETTVEIYFTNGKGKFYNSTPQVQLLDPGTNQMVKKFYRTVDADGNPDPQLHIMPGRYDIAFTEARGVVDKNVEIMAGKKNKIYVVLKATSLSFSYAGDPDRPVEEFAAIVTERNKAQGRVQKQKCTELIEYEPGNYHIEINTFPVDIRNVDLDFNETVIEIMQPGFAKFSGDPTARNITLWRRLGDKFTQFFLLDMNNPASQHLQIQPGEYQVHYQKGKLPGEKVVQFLIKTKQETEVILK